MARYRIVRNPGKEEVDLEEELGEQYADYKIDNQDKAKIVVAELRARAKAAGEKVDYAVVVERAATSTNGQSPGSTSIRLTEEQRKALAKIVGKHMWETGEQMSMGEALVSILEENRKLKGRVRRLEAKLATTEEE